MRNPKKLNEQFHEIFSQYGDGLFYYVLKLTGNEEKAKDIVQECFIRLWENLETIDTDKNLLPLLITYTRNLLVDDFRKEQSHKLFLTSLQQNMQDETDPPDAEQQLALKDRQRQLAMAVSGFPGKRQLIFRLIKQEGLSYKEVAQQLSLSMADVKKQMRLNLQALRKVIHLFLSFCVFLLPILP